MSVPFTQEQEELRRYARQWLDERAPLEVVRRLMETEEGFDSDQWAELADLGWLGIAGSEAHGGSGYGFMGLAVLAEEMGRSLYPSPFMATVVMGASLVGSVGSEAQKVELLSGVFAGERRLAVAAGHAAVHDFTARRSAEEWEVSGSARYVLDGHTAHTLIVEAETPSGPGLFLVDGEGEGVTRLRLDVMDLTRPQADVRLSTAAGVALGGSPLPEGTVEAMNRAVGALTLEQVGGAQRCLDMAVDYAMARHQFGRPIGSFQAIKHMCADMLVAVESARSAAYHLAWALDNDPHEVEVAVPLAKSLCGEAFFGAAADTIQIHGGIGFTWEHTGHLYLKRAKSSQLMFGDGAAHRSTLAERLGIG